MAISDYIFPGLDIASAVLAINRAGKYGNRSSAALEPTSWDADYERMFSDYNSRLQALTGQLADTSSPEFQTRLKTRMDEIMRSYTDSLRQQQSLNAARAGRGLQGYVNPERRDEAISRNLASARQAAEAQARAEVTREMVDAATQTRGALQASGQVGQQGMAMERARRAAQANVQNAGDQSGSAAWLALAKSVLPLAMKGIAFGKATDAATALSRGYVSDAQQAASLGRPFTNPSFSGQTLSGDVTQGLMPANSWDAAPQTWDVAPQTWDTPNWMDLPAVSPSDMDIYAGGIPGFDVPTLPDMNSVDLGDWWALDSSVNWTPDFSGWNLGSGWGW